ncbi:HAD family hydrolase [Flintibacter muris]|uniref:HAD family hydrolase n=1 Tax=Flintibacter muris TaxID=2941327 RepID=UPI00203A6D7A|nr:HAD family hydrolase [Flintibacter muris]
MFKAVCFDFDYTLGDCTDSIVAGFQHALTSLGWPAPDRETVRKTVGFLLEDSYSMLTGDLNPEHQAQFRSLFSDVATERQQRETVLLPGGEELLRGLHARGIKAAIVSTKRGDTIEIILDRLGLADTVDLVVGSADVTRHKPDPEGLLLALDRLGVRPEHALFCGDTVMDAGAARGAGTHFAAVLGGTTPAEASVLTTSLPTCGTWPGGWGCSSPYSEVVFSSIWSRAYCRAIPISSFRERLVRAERSLYRSWRARSMRMVMVTVLSSRGVTINFSIMSHFSLFLSTL